MKTKKKLLILILAILGIIFSYNYFNLSDYLSLDFLKQNANDLKSYSNENLVLSLGAFFLVYVCVTALSIPGAAVLTLAGGFLFGLFKG